MFVLVNYTEAIHYTVKSCDTQLLMVYPYKVKIFNIITTCDIIQIQKLLTHYVCHCRNIL